MKKQIVGIFVMTLLITTAVLPVLGTMNVEINKDVKTSYEPDDIPKQCRRSLPLQLPSWLLELVNGDWNYWSNQPHLYIIPTGNVGIGTTNPGSKLEVAGTIHSTSGGFKFPDGTTQSTAATGGGGAGDEDWAWLSGSGLSGDIYHTGEVIIGSTSSSVGTGITLIGPSTGKKTIGFFKGSDWMGQMGYGDVCDSGSVGLDEALGICSYTGTTTLGTAGMTTLTVKDTGYVGIGTTTPRATLDIKGSETIMAKVDSSDSRSNIQFLINGDERGFFGAVPCPSSDLNSVGICSAKSIIQFGDPSNTHMTLRNGNVGIGTVNPTSKLHVIGKGTFTGGIDPPYISFSKESHESIREYALEVEDHEEVMQFWNDEIHQMEIYVISEDAFYTFTGELIEE